MDEQYRFSGNSKYTAHPLAATTGTPDNKNSSLLGTPPTISFLEENNCTYRIVTMSKYIFFKSFFDTSTSVLGPSIL